MTKVFPSSKVLPPPNPASVKKNGFFVAIRRAIRYLRGVRRVRLGLLEPALVGLRTGWQRREGANNRAGGGSSAVFSPRLDGKVFLAGPISWLKRREREARVLSACELRPHRFSRLVRSPLLLAAICALLVCSASLLAMEIASGNRTLLGMFTLLPLLAVMRVFAPRRAMGFGALWGASLFLFLAVRAQPLIPTTLSAFTLLTAVPAFYALAFGWLARRYGFNPLMLAFGWGFVELLLIPLGLHGGLLGSTVGFASGSVLHLLQSVLGYVCIGVLIVAMNGLALALLDHACQKVCGTARVVRTARRVQNRFFPLEVPVALLYLVSLGRPRAPPI